MNRPTIDVLIDESYFLEALSSTARPASYLENFPDHIFDVSAESRLYKFLYTLLGPAGVSFLKLNYFYSRLVLEEQGFQNDQLDKLYSNPLKFSRSLDESYLESWKGVLDSDSWNQIKALDESYRNRVINFLHAARMGSTPEGMRLAAQSALGCDTLIIEDYNHVFNYHSDQILPYKFPIKSNKNGYFNLEKFSIAPNDAKINETTTVDNEKEHLLENALINLKPVNAVYGTIDNQSDSYVVEAKAILASSEFYNVTRFVTGNPKINWPTSNSSNKELDSIYWIESGLELEAPIGQDGRSQNYCAFYNPQTINASSNAVGGFKSYKELVLKFPFLSDLQSQTWSAKKALPAYAERLTVTHQNNATNAMFINDVYPIDYLKLAGIESLKYDNENFWISKLDYKLTSEYLEIDLGKTVAINFLIFEVLASPIEIDIEYADDISEILPNIQSISCATEPGSVTYTYTLAKSHGLSVGDSVTAQKIEEANTAGKSKLFNGTFIVDEIIDDYSFTVKGLVANITGSPILQQASITKNVWVYQPINFDTMYPNETLVDYQSNNLNKWKTLPYNFDMVYGRFIKIKFKRDDLRYFKNSAFLVDYSVNPTKEKPWPIVVRNLRVGRNIV